jgi:phage shock protein C
MDSTSLVFGLLLISGGVLLLLNNLVPYLKMQKLWPVILIMIGLGLLFNKKKDKNN